MIRFRYYLATREALGLYGDEHGYDNIEDVNAAIQYSEGESIVVVKGVELPIVVKDIKLVGEDTND